MFDGIKVSKEELARFADVQVMDIDRALCAGFEFKTLADVQYFFDDVKKAQKFKKDFNAFLKQKSSK